MLFPSLLLIFLGHWDVRCLPFSLLLVLLASLAHPLPTAHDCCSGQFYGDRHTACSPLPKRMVQPPLLPEHLQVHCICKSGIPKYKQTLGEVSRALLRHRNRKTELPRTGMGQDFRTLYSKMIQIRWNLKQEWSGKPHPLFPKFQFQPRTAEAGLTWRLQADV